MIPERNLWIDGRWVRPVRGGRIDVINPATEQVIGSIPAATGEILDRRGPTTRATRTTYHAIISVIYYRGGCRVRR